MGPGWYVIGIQPGSRSGEGPSHPFFPMASDPVSVSGVDPANKRWPLVFSAAFTQSLSPARWKALRWRFFRLHFQYLCAFDRPKDYDYFQITAGPLLLRDRYAARTPSRSVKDKPVNRFRTTAP